MNAELLLPAEAGVLREALFRWAERNRPAVPAAERVRRIRAQLNAAKGQPLYATAREPKVSRLSWLAAACAAALVASACAGWLYLTLGQPAAPVAVPETTEKKKAVAENAKTPPAVVGAVRDGTPGLFVRTEETPARWVAVAKDSPLHAGDVLQVAAAGQACELAVFGSHRVKVAPGTTVRLGEDPDDPRVGFYWGRMDAWAEGGQLRVSSITANAWDASDVCKLAEGEHLLIASIDPLPMSARTLQQDGFNLADPAALPRMPFSAKIDQNVDGNPPDVAPPKPENVRVQQGTANLLNVIDADLADVPVKDAVETFVTLIKVRIKLSPAAEQAAGAKKVTLKAEKLTGAEVLAKFCTLAGLSFHVEQGEIVLRLPNEPRTAPAAENPEF
ncbi:MAG: hypothetical protein L6R28_03290 [Planctomycetes bacterium]|nr:hypothetical protein [Planctomycetota bacterium]